MRKAFIILTGILFTLLCATCKQFTADIDGYLSYWSSEAFIRSSAIDTKTYNDGSGIASIASAKDVTVTLKVQNPKSFKFVMPSASETRNIVGFAHFDGTKPAVSADYELKQLTADTLQLVYKKSFLKNSEWGEKDVSSTITLYANDGRVFKQTFTVPLKVNTPPPNPGFAVIKTKGSPAYYVLCFTVPDMDKTVPGGLLHKDLARIEVNGTPYTFSVNEAQTAFTKPEAPVFITHSDVEKLTEPEADDVPADSSWVLYYKTDVEVKDGAAKKDYTIKLIDKKGLASGIVNASTKPNKAETEIVRITKGTEISGSGSSESDPTIIGTDSEGATLSVSSATGNTTVHCTVSEIGGSTPKKYDGNPVTVPLPLNGDGAKKYKLEYYTDGEGFTATPVKTVYYKVVKGHTVSFDANGGAYPGGATVVSKVALHGTTTSQPNQLPKKPGYGLTGWYDNAGTTGTAWNFDMDTVTGNITLYAQWTEDVDTPYNVEHYQQKLDGSYPEEPTETEGKTGTTNAPISADSIKKNYEGFEYDYIVPANPKIGADGKTVVKVYYKRKTYTVNYNVDGSDGTISVTAVTGGSLPPPGSPVTVKHGGSITFKATPNLAWKIEGWTLGSTAVNGTDSTYSLSNIKSNKDVKVKFKKVTTVKHTDDNAWKLLKEVVKIADNHAVITIEGEIKATDDAGNNGVINTYKILTIKGDNPSAALNANGKSGILDAHNTLTLQDITLKNGKWLGSHSGGAGVYVNSGGTLIMQGSSTIEDCSAANSGGGVYVSGGTFEMHGSSKITRCSASKGGGVYVSGGIFKMHGSSAITGCKAKDYGGAIFVNGATVNITNCTLKGNEAAEAGGAIYAQKQKDGPTSTVTISGGTIGGTGTGEKNKVTGKWHFGGGIFVNDDCTLTLDSVRIIGNEAWRAGGVRANRSTVKMTNCTIKNNKTTGDNDSGGGGVYTFMGTLTMTGCTITGNEAATNGGGLNIEGTPATITNCTFTRNTAKNGGGIYTIKTDSYPVVTISGGTIGDTDMDSANKATGSDGNGGGIYVGEFCTLRLQDSTDSGVRIIGNQAAKGGGVYAKNTIVSMQGRTQIEVDNNDVYLDSGSLISIVESLAATGPVARARITVPNDKYQTATKVLTGSAVNTEYRKFTVTPKGSENWTVGSDGQLTNNKTDIFNTITRDQIEAAIKAADPSMIYDDWCNPITNRKAKLTNKLVLYETAQGHYGIMHVTEVDNTTYGGKGHIKFNSKTFNQYGGVLREETDKVLTGDESFQFEAGRDPGGNLDFTFGNGPTDEEKTFKPLNGAKFYILSN